MNFDSREIFILTAQYPYEYAETFFEDELRIINPVAERITIISCEGGAKVNPRYLPAQAEVVCCRNHRYEVTSLFFAILQMFCAKTWREMIFANRILGYKKQSISVAKQIFIYYYITAELTKISKKIKIPENAIIYAYWMNEEAYFLSKYKRKHPDTVCVCRTHGSDCYIDKFYQPFRREILNNLDAVFPVSEAGKKSIETLLVPHIDGKGAPLLVQRLGIFKISEKMNPIANSNTFCIVTCSNVIELKRLDLLIDALALIQDLDIQWVHFGDGELMESIQCRAKEKLKGKTIAYTFAGKVPKTEILKWYETNHADVFVNCSDSEGIPVSIMEAFAYGIPAIARNVGGVGEIVKTDYNGKLLPNGCTPEQLKEAIVLMARSSQETMKRMRSGAYNTYNRDYCAEKNYQSFYNQLLKLQCKSE